MNAEQVMIEVGEKLDEIPGVVVVDYDVTSLPSLPALTVSNPPSGTFDQTYGQGLDTLKLRITAFVSKVKDSYSRGALSPFISGSGERSVRARLGSRGIKWRTCSMVKVTDFQTVIITWDAQTKYLAAVFTADVYGSGGA